MFPLDILGSDAYLCDFGILVKAGTLVPNKLQSPKQYRAPELFRNIEPSFASDMWSHMAVFSYLYTEAEIFTGRGFASTVGSFVQHVGRRPSEWKGCCRPYDKEEVKASQYGQTSQVKDAHDLIAFLDQHRLDISASERALALSEVQKVFRPRPQDRLIASELLGDKDFKSLMNIHGV